MTEDRDRDRDLDLTLLRWEFGAEQPAPRRHPARAPGTRVPVRRDALLAGGQDARPDREERELREQHELRLRAWTLCNLIWTLAVLVAAALLAAAARHYGGLS